MEKERRTRAEGGGVRWGRGEGECGIVLSERGEGRGEKRVKRKGEKGENAGKEKHWLERVAAGMEETLGLFKDFGPFVVTGQINSMKAR